MPRLIQASIAIAVWFGFGSLAVSGTVYWGSQGFQRSTDSSGNDWKPGFTLHLGVFESTFSPSPLNVDEWQARWIELDLATYDAMENRFAGQVDDSTALPEGAGNQVFLWALDGENLEHGAEWLLLTRDDWRWSGRPSLASDPAKTWIADQAATTIVGQVANGPVHLSSAAVRPTPVPMADWLAARLPGTSDQAPEADPDRDGLANRMEYFLGSDPAQASPPITPEIQIAGKTVSLTLPRNPYAETRVSLEKSSDLKSWQAVSDGVTTERPDRIEHHSPGIDAGNPVFYRFHIQEGASE